VATKGTAVAVARPGLLNGYWVGHKFCGFQNGRGLTSKRKVWLWMLSYNCY